MIIWETSFITQNLIKYLSQIKSAIFFVIEKVALFNADKVKGLLLVLDKNTSYNKHKERGVI